MAGAGAGRCAAGADGARARAGGARDRGGPEEFATVCLAWISPDRHKLRVLLAGHHRPLLVAPAGNGGDAAEGADVASGNGGAGNGADGGGAGDSGTAGRSAPLVVVEASFPYGPPLGIMEPGDADWGVEEIDLPPRWSLLLYTDGLVEGLAVPHSRERFGLRRLLPIVARELNSDPEAALDRLVAQVQTANGRPFADDIALLLVQTRR